MTATVSVEVIRPSKPLGAPILYLRVLRLMKGALDGWYDGACFFKESH